MKLFDDLLQLLSDGIVEDVRIGPFWTAVVVQTESGTRRCGLASSLRRTNHSHSAGPEVKEPGAFTTYSALQLATLIRSDSLMEASVGMATINALLPRLPQQWVNVNAEAVLAEQGAGKEVVVVGHFPFIPRLKEAVGKLSVLELNPTGDDLPATAAADVIPQADLVAITGTSLINGTFDNLISLCSPKSTVMVLGPSTPLSPLLFDYGVNLISGSIVKDTGSVLKAICQGGNFRQVKNHGVTLVTMSRL